MYVSCPVESNKDSLKTQEIWCVTQVDACSSQPPKHSLVTMKLSTLLLVSITLPATAFVSTQSRLQKPVFNPLTQPSFSIHHDIMPIQPSSTKRQLSTSSIMETVSSIGGSLLSSSGHVPFNEALALNVVLFTLLRQKLLKLLTPQGMLHACALGSGLWATLGWKGWTLCVAYLFLGSAVTKVKFAEKEKRGIAEGRGGRRGPENVW